MMSAVEDPRLKGGTDSVESLFLTLIFKILINLL